MRNYPVDAERAVMISTGAVSPVQVWVELSDGSRRPDPSGRQESSADGRPLWRVEVVTPAVEGDERDRTEVITVTVASHARPEPGRSVSRWSSRVCWCRRATCRARPVSSRRRVGPLRASGVRVGSRTRHDVA